jgi:hypothetical protein
VPPSAARKSIAPRAKSFCDGVSHLLGEEARIARAVRVEFAGGLYHVMAREDRQGAIVRDDMDRATFLRTLAEASELNGFRITRSG